MKKLILYSLLTGLSGLFVLLAIFAIARLSPSQAYRVAFMSYEANSMTVYVMNPDGEGQRELTPHEDQVFKNAPSWAPGANELAYIQSNSRDFRAKLLRVDIFGNETPIYSGDSGHESTEPVWSPDGNRIVYGVRYPTRQHLQYVDIDANTTRDVTTPTDNVFHYNPRWSPDSERLAFIEFRTGEQSIHTVNRDGSDLKNVTELAGYTGTDLREVQWSPDGQWISFVGNEEATVTFEIFLLRTDGTKYRQLPSVDGQPTNLRWSPDSQWLLFTFLFGDGLVYRMRIEDGYLEELPIVSNPNQPVTWSPDGMWLYYTQLSDSELPDLFRSRPDGSGEQQLTHSSTLKLAPEPSPLVDRNWHLWIHGLIIGLGFVTLGRGVYARSRLSGRTGSESRQ